MAAMKPPVPGFGMPVASKVAPPPAKGKAPPPAKGKAPPAKGKGPKWTPKSDMAADKKAGIKPGSKKDNALDKKRGVPVKD